MRLSQACPLRRAERLLSAALNSISKTPEAFFYLAGSLQPPWQPAGQQTGFYPNPKIRPALSGGMDWWRMERPLSRVRKIFFRGRISRRIPVIPQKRAIFNSVHTRLHCKDKRDLQGVFVKIGDFVKFKGFLVEFLENRRS